MQGIKYSGLNILIGIKTYGMHKQVYLRCERILELVNVYGMPVTEICVHLLGASVAIL